MIPEEHIYLTYKKQLGNLYNVMDDCIWYTSEFLDNKDFFQLFTASRYFFFSEILEKRLEKFKKRRKDIIEISYLKRDPQYQFANMHFRMGNCVVSECRIKRGRLQLSNVRTQRNNNYMFTVPYCAYHWNTTIKTMYQ